MKPWHPTRLLANWFGCGLMPIAPGTWGSLGALPFAYAITYFHGPLGLAVAAILITLVGIWASERTAKAIGRDDPGEVVIDEVAGQWITLVPACLNPVLFVAGFFVFRLFDIWKPWPASVADSKLHGGLGIMLDDVMAGIYGATVIYVLSFVTGGTSCLPNLF